MSEKTYNHETAALRTPQANYGSELRTFPQTALPPRAQRQLKRWAKAGAEQQQTGLIFFPRGNPFSKRNFF